MTDNKQENEKVATETTSPVKMGDWLKVYKENDEIKDNVFTTEEDCELDVTPPARYDEKLPEFEVPPGHTKQTMNDIYDYFVGILDNEYRLRVLNDHELDDPWGIRSRMIQCDYCRITTAMWMRHCKECNMDMCDLCYKERTEEDAKKNGAKNWAKRKDALLACFEHEKQGHFDEKEVDTLDLAAVNCDICRANSREKKGTWSCNRRADKDLCLACLNSEEHKAEVREMLEESEGTWKFVNFSRKRDYGFGSWLDWVPLFRDEETGAALFYNMNPDSEYYHQVTLSAVDDHGREGYFVYSGTLEEVVQEIRDSPESEEQGGWEAHYDCPIMRLLLEAGHEVYYG